MPALGFGGGGTTGGSTPPLDPNNAFVDVDASILPPQAFVDNIEAFGLGEAVTLTAKGFTYVSPELIANAIHLEWLESTGTSAVMNLADNELDVDNIDGILSAVAGQQSADGITGGVLNIGGEDMGSPTPAVPAVPHVDAVLALNFAPVDQAAIIALVGPKPQLALWDALGSGQFTIGATSIDFTFQPLINFGASTVNVGAGVITYTIGTLDSPSNVDIIGWMIANWSAVAPSDEIVPSLDTDYLLLTCEDGGMGGFSGITETQPYDAGSHLLAGTVTFGTNFATIYFDPRINLAASDAGGDITGVPVDPYINLGIADLPSAFSLSTKFAALWNAIHIDPTWGSLDAAIASSDTTFVALTDSREADYPIADFAPVTAPPEPMVSGLVQHAKIPGTVAVAEVINANLTALIAEEWTGAYQDSNGDTVTF